MNQKYIKPTPDKNLIYIDDVINKLVKLLKYNNIKTYEKVFPIYKVNTLKVQNLVERFNIIENNHFVDDLGNSFVKKLYSTFLTFLPSLSLSIPF